MTLLVVSAVFFEAEASLHVLKKKDPSLEYFELGIGPLHAAKSAAALKEKCRGKDVLYLGSCGSFYAFDKAHLITVDTVYWMPPCLRAGLSGAPEGLYPPYTFPEASLPLPKKSVLTSPTVSLTDHFDTDLETKLPSKEDLVENMELYACAEALLEAKSLHTILGVTNQVGPEGRKQWASNFRDIAFLTSEFLNSFH